MIVDYVALWQKDVSYGCGLNRTIVADLQQTCCHQDKYLQHHDCFLFETCPELKSEKDFITSQVECEYDLYTPLEMSEHICLIKGMKNKQNKN